MRSRGDSSLRIVSEEQAHALASAALDYGTEAGRPNRAEWLVARVSAILAADVVLLTHAGGQWTIMTAAPGDHPFTSRDALDPVRRSDGRPGGRANRRRPGLDPADVGARFGRRRAGDCRRLDHVARTVFSPGRRRHRDVQPARRRGRCRRSAGGDAAALSHAPSPRARERSARRQRHDHSPRRGRRRRAARCDCRHSGRRPRAGLDRRDIRLPTCPGRTCTDRARRRGDRHRHALAQTAVHDDRRSVDRALVGRDITPARSSRCQSSAIAKCSARSA